MSTPTPPVAPHAVVVDIRDGYTWGVDGNGEPLTLETAHQYAATCNRRPGVEPNTYRVFTLQEA